jgi:hypothetical protein
MSSKKQRSRKSPGLPALAIGDVLRALPPRELSKLIERVGVVVDEQKRIDVPSQVARALINLPEARDPSRLPGPTAELFYRIAEAKGVLVVDSLPPAVAPLVASGIVFARGAEGGRVELVLPIAYMVQVRSWEGEDPRGLRALVSQANPEVAAAIASHYLGRPATPPYALAFEAAWLVLNDEERLREEIDELAPLERKLLRSIEKVGGEVETEELLDLEREPMRLRGATGATPTRRGVGFALERRGFLVPVHPNRHVIPSEVARIVGAQRRAEREAQRREIRSFVLEEDHAPRRASFAADPVPLALAMALATRDPSFEIKSGIGTPRSLISKLSTRFGAEQDAVALLASLSRAVGLWDPSAVNTASPPGSTSVGVLSKLLFNAWRQGGAWDDARPDGEVLRVASEVREASSVGVLREMVLDALRELSDGRWAPWEAVAAYVRADSRTPGVGRLLSRWGQRAGVEPAAPAEIARRIALETLHHLGIVDLGEPDEEGAGPTLRITPRGRVLLGGDTQAPAADPSVYLDGQVLRIGTKARIGDVLSLSPFVEIGAISVGLDLSITPHAVSLALAAGYDADFIRARLESVAELPDPIERMLAQAAAVLGRAEFIPTQGFLWVEDEELREMLRTRRQTADLFVDPSPPSGLLINPGVDVEKLARRCRSLGVEVVVDGEVYRTRSMTPSPRGSGMRRVDSSTSTRASSKSSSTRRRRSSVKMPALKRGGG